MRDNNDDGNALLGCFWSGLFVLALAVTIGVFSWLI